MLWRFRALTLICSVNAMCPSPESAVEALFFALTALVVQPAISIAQPQLGLDVEDDTLTRTVLIHSPVETPKDRPVFSSTV